MKKHLVIVMLLCIFGSLHAQTTIVYGNLGVENVNISVINTQYGTSSDAQGHYELQLYDCSKTVNLYYSCIGYQDTVVSLTPRQLQCDSINISFKMRKMSYDLQEVGVLAYSDFFRSRRGTNIADIAFFDNWILVLENGKRNSTLRLLDLDGNDLASTDLETLYDELYIDAFGDYLLLAQICCTTQPTRSTTIM